MFIVIFSVQLIISLTLIFISRFYLYQLLVAFIFLVKIFQQLNYSLKEHKYFIFSSYQSEFLTLLLYFYQYFQYFSVIYCHSMSLLLIFLIIKQLILFLTFFPTMIKLTLICFYLKIYSNFHLYKLTFLISFFCCKHLQFYQYLFVS